MNTRLTSVLAVVICMAFVCAGCGGTTTGTNEPAGSPSGGASGGGGTGGGGSGGGGEGGGGGEDEETGEYVLQAKQIAAAAAYATMMATMTAFDAAFVPEDCLGSTSADVTSSANFYRDPTSEADNNTMTVDYTYECEGNVFDGFIYTLPEEEPCIHTSKIVVLHVLPFLIDDAEYSDITYATAGDSNPLTGSIYGYVDFMFDEGAIIASTANFADADLDVAGLEVTLEDGTSGTADVVDWTAAAALSVEDNTLVAAIENKTTTVTYSGETYNCTDIDATLVTPLGGEEDPVFSLTSASCTAATPIN